MRCPLGERDFTTKRPTTLNLIVDCVQYGSELVDLSRRLRPRIKGGMKLEILKNLERPACPWEQLLCWVDQQ